MQRSLAHAAVALALLAPAVGWAAPFRFTPASFQQWLNANPEGWPFDSRITFTSLGSCREYKNAWPDSYSCREGFARVSDAMGIRICQVEFLWGNGSVGHFQDKYPRKISRIRIVKPTTPGNFSQVGEYAQLGECRWQ
jgi:hypothetical protein